MEFTNKDYVKSLVFDGLYNAFEAHRILFKKSNNNNSIASSLSYLSDAYSCFKTLSLIMEFDETYKRQEFTDCLNQFNIFHRELMRNVRDDHSHQWTDIEFEALLTKSQLICNLLDIDMNNFK